jgi:hypothetical protein
MSVYQCLVCDNPVEPENQRPHPICATCRREGWTVRWDGIRGCFRRLLGNA